MKNFKDLEVYQHASSLFPKVYRLVRSWNMADQRELGSQIIRAANSIHANIAEGYSKSPLEFKRYLAIAIASCDELASHIEDAFNVGLLQEVQRAELLAEYTIVGKQLTKLKQIWK
jgi:four helix bundle protein